MSEEGAFEFAKGNTNFLCRNGAAFAGGVFSNRKLCFTSTRRDLLERHLLALSRRSDCFWVKFGVKARDGMFLGRCFLTTDEAVGQVWTEYKRHPSLFCTVQDDDFTQRFRELSKTLGALWIDDDRRA
jgi:hypothetical protein